MTVNAQASLSAGFDFSVAGGVAQLDVIATFNTTIRSGIALDASFVDFERDGSPLSGLVVDEITITGAVLNFKVSPSPSGSEFPQGTWNITISDKFESTSYDPSIVATVTITVDTIPPVVESITPVGTGTQPKEFYVNVNFNESISADFAETADPNVCLTQSTFSSSFVSFEYQSASSTSNTLNYKVSVSADINGTMSLAFACASRIHDLAGNVLSTSNTPTPVTAVFDAKKPIVQSYELQLINGQIPCPFDFSVTFDENLKANSAPSVVVTIGADSSPLSGTASAVAESHFTFTVPATICRPGGVGYDEVLTSIQIVSDLEYDLSIFSLALDSDFAPQGCLR